MNSTHKTISKFLSLILRHDPQKIGLELDENGWASIEELLQKARSKQPKLDRALLEEIVATNDKKRFAISEDGSKIRASQGHSIKIDLDYQPKEPPAFLYHGTVPKFMREIKQNGLLKMSRHHVHLSEDKLTATRVGARRGVPIILSVRSGEMHTAGFKFYQSENEVWLTEHVPSEYIEL